MDPAKDALATLYTGWYDGTGEMSGVTDAAVVLILKIGSARDQANYRPISLLNALYKVYASILKDRLAAGLEQSLHGTQYGIREGRSTSAAIYCVRRVQDMLDRGGRKGHILLLDWKKAFDRAHMDRVAEFLERMRCPAEPREAISRVFQPARFRTRVGGVECLWHWQRRGIRQGCPLSPYLLIVVIVFLGRTTGRALWGRPRALAGAQLR